MTLLEALVALVVLGLTSLGFLGAFQGASRATRDAATWVEAVGYAETVMEQTRLGPVQDIAPLESATGGLGRDIRVQPWDAVPGIDVVTVTVRLPDGGSFELHRLARPR